MTLTRDGKTFTNLRLCLKAGNDVFLVSRGEPIKISNARRCYQDPKGEDKKIVVKVDTEKGALTLLAGDKLSTCSKHPYEWLV